MCKSYLTSQVLPNHFVTLDLNISYTGYNKEHRGTLHVRNSLCMYACMFWYAMLCYAGYAVLWYSMVLGLVKVGVKQVVLDVYVYLAQRKCL